MTTLCRCDWVETKADRLIRLAATAVVPADIAGLGPAAAAGLPSLLIEALPPQRLGPVPVPLEHVS